MIVCRIRPDLSFEVIDREKDMIRLGAGGLDGRRLARLEPGRGHADAGQVSSGWPSRTAWTKSSRPATSAVREAENGGGFHRSCPPRRRHPRPRDFRHRRSAPDSPGGRLRRRRRRAARPSSSTSAAAARRSRSAPRRACSSAAASSSASFGSTERFATTDPLSRPRRAPARAAHRSARRASYLRQIAQARLRARHRHVGHDSLARRARRRRAGGRPRKCAICASSVKALRPAAQAADVKMTLDERLQAARPRPAPRRSAPCRASCCSTRSSSELGADELTLCDFALREGLVLDYIQKNARAHPHGRALSRRRGAAA